MLKHCIILTLAFLNTANAHFFDDKEQEEIQGNIQMINDHIRKHAKQHSEEDTRFYEFKRHIESRVLLLEKITEKEITSKN